MATADGINDAENRVMGMMLGSALGDAVGLYTEFMSATEAEKAYPKGVFRLDPTGDKLTKYFPDRARAKFFDAGWTDDTDMALCITLAFLHTGALDQMVIAERFAHYAMQGIRLLDTMPDGIGRQIRRVLNQKDYPNMGNKGPEEAARAYWVDTESSSYGEKGGAGNGAIMRTHPIGAICINKNLGEACEAAAEICRTTHVDPRAVISALIGTAVARALIRGELSNMQQLDELMQACVKWYDNRRYPEDSPVKGYRMNADRKAELSRIVTAESLAKLNLDEKGKEGYTYKTLGAAIYCLREAMSRMNGFSGPQAGREQLRKSLFEELITKLTMAAGDADTNGAVAGALLGAYLGYDAIPAHWRNGMRNKDVLIEKSRSLCMALKVIPGNYVFGSEADTALDGGRVAIPSDKLLDKKAANDKRKENRLKLLKKRWSS